MKKSAFITATLLVAATFSSVAIANSQEKNVTQKVQPEQQNLQKPAQTLPMAVLGVFDISGKEPKLMDGNTFSRSKKRQLCLFVKNVQLQEQNQLVEYIKAPNAIEIIVDGAEVKASEDKKEFLISFNIPKEKIVNDVVQCWEFGRNDPIGTYQFEAQFNDNVFKGLSFKILK